MVEPGLFLVFGIPPDGDCGYECMRIASGTNQTLKELRIAFADHLLACFNSGDDVVTVEFADMRSRALYCRQGGRNTGTVICTMYERCAFLTQDDAKDAESIVAAMKRTRADAQALGLDRVFWATEHTLYILSQRLRMGVLLGKMDSDEAAGNYITLIGPEGEVGNWSGWRGEGKEKDRCRLDPQRDK